eukprot:6778175-Karenia_brevis.AAC.1
MIDYALMQRNRKVTVRNVEATWDISLGADHRALRVDLDFKIKTSKRRNSSMGPQRKNMWSWQPGDAKTYCDGLDHVLEAEDINAGNMLENELEQRCRRIEAILLDISEKCRTAEEQKEDQHEIQQRYLHKLINERRLAREQGAKEKVADICKHIHRELRAIKRAKRQAKISRILEEFKGLQLITGIRDGGKRKLITSMTDKTGEMITGNKNIADVFADFYEDLYEASRKAPLIGAVDSRVEDITPITVAEIRAQLQKMKGRK